jgi:hypothetical protein
MSEEKKIGLRYAGAEGSLVLMNSTTGDELMAGMPLASIKWSFPLELVKKQYIGDIGPTYREFSDGYELEAEVEPDDAEKFVAIINAVKAKAEGASSDEFAAQAKYASPSGSTFQVTFRDLHWEGIPGDMGGRTEFLKTTFKAKGKVYKVQVI